MKLIKKSSKALDFFFYSLIPKSVFGIMPNLL